MRAMQVVTHGEPLQACEVAKQSPAAGEVGLRILATGLNFADLLMAAGTYQEKPTLPFSPGMEICGIVDSLGDGVSTLRVGDRVALYAGYGGLAEYGCFPADHCSPVPDDMSSERAAAFPVVYGTAHVALIRRARLQRGERLLVLGAGGGAGLAAVEIGAMIGAEVIAAASSMERLTAAKAAGACHAIDLRCEDLRQRVKELGGADVVFDPVGGERFREAMRCVNPEARLLPIGFASGEVPQIPANIVLIKNISIIGMYWGGYRRFAPKILDQCMQDVWAWRLQGRLTPPPVTVFPLTDAEMALDQLRYRKAVGKVVVKVADDPPPGT